MKYALVIGISEYQSPHLMRLPKTLEGAEHLAKFLATYGMYKVERLPKSWNRERETWEITNKVVTKEEIVNALKTLLWETAKNSDVLLYFAGHGIKVLNEVEKLDGYIATSETTIEFRNDKIVEQNKAIPLKIINDLITNEKCQVSSLVMLLDFCHSGSLLENLQIRETLTKFVENDDYYLIAACRSFEKARALKGEKYSIFTNALLKGLEIDKTDDNGDITCETLFSVINTELKNSGQEPIRIGGGRSITLLHYSRDNLSTKSHEQTKISNQDNRINKNQSYVKNIQYVDEVSPVDIDKWGKDNLLKKIWKFFMDEK